MTITKLLCCSLLLSTALYSRAAVLDIRHFGAVPDSLTLNTAAIQAAIDSCARGGGGQVRVPAGGIYRSGTLFLKSGVMLHLEAGATLQGSPDMAHYDRRFPHLIYAEGVAHSGITGHGTIHGSGAAFWDENFEPRERPLHWLKFVDSQHLVFEGPRLLHSPSHVLVLRRCDGVRIQGLHIFNPPRSPNTDGIDITDTRNVSIHQCHIETGDDAICLKSHDRWVEHVVASDNLIISDDAGIKFGTGGQVGVRYCVFSNNILRHVRYGIALFQMDGGRFEHCQFTNTIIHTASRHKTEYPIFIDIDKRRADGPLGSIEGLLFSHIQIVTRGNCLIAGQPQAKISNLVMDNITLSAAPSPAADLRQARKPRGNKTLGYYADMKDYAPTNAWFVLAHIEGLTLKHLRVHDPTKARKATKLIEVRKWRPK